MNRGRPKFEAFVLINILVWLALVACVQGDETNAPALPPGPSVDQGRATAPDAITSPAPTATPPPSPASPTPAEQGSHPVAPLPPYLVRVEPSEGAQVSLDFRVCAVFDATNDGLGRDWGGPVWFNINAIQIQQGIDTVSRQADPIHGIACTSGLRSLLGEEVLDSTRPVMEGPIDLTLRYREPSGEEYRYSWQVRLLLPAPEAPPEVHRVRQAHNLMQKVRERTGDSVADHYLNLDDHVLHVYLTQDADPEPVRSVVEEVFGDRFPSGGVRVSRGDEYPPDQLARWYEAAQQAVWTLEGTWYSDLNERLGRIDFGVQTGYAAHEAREALSDTDVPQEAVAIEVAPERTLDSPPVQENSLIGVGISLDFPGKTQAGQLVLIEVVLTNNGPESVSFVYNPHHPMNVMVFTSDGEQVWAKQRGGLITAPASEGNLAPSEQLRFPVYWDLTDQDGFALPPGEYLVQGTSNIHDYVDNRARPMELTTRPYEMVISPPEE